jgi:hypothetical protein
MRRLPQPVISASPLPSPGDGPGTGIGKTCLIRKRYRLEPRSTQMFFFFSSRLGCLGSIAVSLVLTLILLSLFGVF